MPGMGLRWDDGSARAVEEFVDEQHSSNGLDRVGRVIPRDVSSDEERYGIYVGNNGDCGL